ncbi:S41 family peptidase [Thioalkalivibrio sulfidiphilus]|uniref:Carboxyl-terminal protease n=1 Tax=Thioalkalivibrio sulfidiphilus (strain HL-EbGR7) TaxID=396588 RepID=B8GRA1_THISH|nr:S41 family peptidase [Thioalkalivibrio sulfidiphilus]ACL74355.1 carboxyl-terminal protease [Thioalkalivibrio sulfidiphilus HL-EbGr7]
MKSTTRISAGVLTGILLGFALSLSFGVFANKQENEAIPLEDLRAFTDVYMRIKRNYVDYVDDTTLLENAIRGMLSGLDPHSSYLTPRDFQDLQIGTSGEFGGLGLEVGMEDGFVKVISPIDDTPASRAGVRAGDLIIRLDDKPVKGMTLNEAVNEMRGPKGTDITLTIMREGADQPIRITLTRDTIRVRSVRSEMLEPGFAYVRISNFQSRTAQNLVEEINKLQREGNGLRGLILDLRNNPGGVLNGAVGVSDAFLEDGLIVYTEGRTADAQFRYQASPGDVLKGAPMVVLVNEGSASASEIVAGALQDHQRAVIMGTRTFGKGSVQTILPLRQDTALKLTTARYYTPEGRSIQAEGIEPDIKLERLQVSAAETDGSRPVTEASLQRHLQRQRATEEAGEQPADNGSLAQRDYQLYEALNLLKGLTILQARR